MSIQQMQQQIIDQVATLNDENMLIMLQEELAYYHEHKQDPTALLSEKDLEELIMIANEPLENNTMSLDEFKNIIDKWHMK